MLFFKPIARWPRSASGPSLWSLNGIFVLCGVLLGTLSVRAETICQSSIPMMRNSRVLEVAIKWDGVEARSAADPGSPVRSQLGFSESFVAFEEKLDYFCLGDLDRNFVGWVDREDLLFSKEAERDPETTIFLKVMIRNNLGADARENAGTLWSHPTRRSNVENRSPLYTVHYVFDVHTTRSKNYYLVGSGPTWSRDTSQEDLLGWIESDLVFLWRTRVAVQFAEGLQQQTVHLYPLRRDLDRVLAGEQPEPSFLGSTSEEWNWERERFPILSEESPRRGGRRILKLGAFGGAGEFTAGEFDSQGAAFARMAAGSRLLDIVFLIDGTESMKPAFEEARRAVRRVRQQGVLRDANYAVGMYKDGKPGYPVIHTGLTSETVDDQLSLLMKDAGRDTGDRDYEEAVLEGIVYALEQMRAQGRWRENSVRALILIGDHGDHQEEPGHSNRMRRVATLLREDRVRFMSYQTENFVVSAEGKTAYREFLRDADELGGQLSDLFPQAETAKGDALAIAEGLLEIRQFSGDVRTGLLLFAQGEPPPVRVGPYILRLLEDNGISEADLRSWGTSVQVCDEGWALATDDQRREIFEKRLRISKDDLERVKIGFRDLLDDLGDRERCLNAMFRAMRAATGDVPTPEDSPRSFLRRKLGIEVKSRLLSLSFEALADHLIRSEQSRRELREALETSVRLLEAVQYERRLRDDLEPDLDSEQEFIRERWWKILPDGTTVAWIPEGYLP